MLNRQQIVKLLGEDAVRELESYDADEVDREGRFIRAERCFEVPELGDEYDICVNVKLTYFDIYSCPEEGWEQPKHADEFELYGNSKRDDAFINIITRGFI